MSDIDIQQVKRRIDECKEAWQAYFPKDNFDWFMERVETAIDIFYPLSELRELSAELKQIEKAARRPSAEFLSIVENASPSAREFLEQHKTLSDLPLPDNPGGIGEFANEIRSRIVVSEHWQPEGSKRRKKPRVALSQTSKRPKRQSVEVLVSRLAAAYVSACGKNARRSWSNEDKEPIEVIVGDIFFSLGIEDTHSATKALRRHITTRNLL